MMERNSRGGAQGVMRAQMQAGLAALQQGNGDEARNVFSTLLEANPRLAAAHVGLGRVFASEGDHHKALEHYQEALAIKPDFAPAVLFSAEAREQLGETEAALVEYEDAVTLDPSLGFGYLRMARLLTRENRDGEALKLLREAVLRSPQDAGLRLMLANALARQGEPVAAESEYRRVIDLKPDLWLAHYQLGKLHLRARAFAPARDALSRAAALAPSQVPVQQALGAALAGLGEHGRAAKSYDEALRLKPDSVRAAVQAARSRSAAGKHREGLDLLLGLGRVARRSGLVQKALGDIYLAMARPRDAVDCYRALILNTPRMRTAAPEVVALAEAENPEDIAGFAERLRDALAVHVEALTNKVRTDPHLLRDRLSARREGATG